MKRIAKNLLAIILGWQVRRLQRNNAFKVVAVTGSIGKTSTKLAIAHVLSQKYRVRYQNGNYNDIVFVPLVFFDRAAPNIFNPFGWLTVFLLNELTLLRDYPYDFVIAELGTDAPGQIAEFSKYINANIGVLTSITPEHMANFEDLEAVAKEELSLAQFSGQLLVSEDLVESKYLSGLEIPFQTYSVKSQGDYSLSDIKFNGNEAAFKLLRADKVVVDSRHNQITEPQLYSIAAAAAIGDIFDMSSHQIDKGIQSLKPVSGRMQNLAGINGSTIIDDTYNASPEAVKAALDTLYRIDAPQKIAVLGNMNELGKYAETEHVMIGNYCDAKELNLVLTLGPDANKFLAAAAKTKGCQVKSFDDPYSAGEYLKTVIKDGALILIKGSQNKVFAEEVTKLLLADPEDASKLVRQSPHWLKIKQKNFF